MSVKSSDKLNWFVTFNNCSLLSWGIVSVSVKREILRYHLDNLLEQGIISPVKEKDDLPITSPIVLVTKRTNSTDKNSPQNHKNINVIVYTLSQFVFLHVS
jgi:hypothetical protein